MATEELASFKLSDWELTNNKIKGYLDSILKCAEQEKVLVDDVLDMSKLANSKVELVPVPFFE